MQEVLTIEKELANRYFYPKAMLIAIPIALQQFVNSALNMSDTFMVGQLGDAAVAAVGISNQFFFFLLLFLIGLNAGGAVFMSQLFGAGDKVGIQKVFRLISLIGVVLMTAGALAAFFGGSFIAGLYSKDLEVIGLANDYLKVVAFAYTTQAISFACSTSFRSTGKASVAMRISVLAIGMNILLNYIFIFGKLGFPAMGVEGSALGTAIARLAEMLGLLAVTVRYKEHLFGIWQKNVKISKDFYLQFLRITAPVFLNDGLWGIAFNVCTMAYARIGTAAMAAVQITRTIEELLFVVIIGISSASAILLAQYIGAGREDIVYRAGKKLAILGLVTGIFAGVILFSVAPIIVGIFKVTEATSWNVVTTLRAMAAVQILKYCNILLITGVLRSGGDTLFAMLVETSTMWLIAIPLAFFGAVVLHLPLYQVVLLVAIEEVVKLIIVSKRFTSRKWINNIVGKI
ncbi:MAG: MATE family efflux transporter [Clostridia bacterium]